MLYLLVFGGLALFIGLCVLADYARLPWHLRERDYPKGHARTYDPTGEKTYL